MYPYSPLTEAKNEIRLLHLFPANFDDDICCSLQHAELIDNLEFTALSYTWGDPNVKCSILIDGHPVNVTINLYNALRYMRDDNNTRIFWIDAVCINQDDLDERGKQVLRMRDIYTMPTSVEVWLGKADTNGADAGAVDLVKEMAALFEDPEEMLARGSDANAQDTFREEMEKTSPTAVKALTDLFKRPWWTRIWVVQELSLAKQYSAIVRVGHLTTPWLSWLITAYAIESSWFIVNYLATSVSADRRLEGYLQGIRMAQCRKLDPTLPGFTLLELLNQHRDCEATNPRDKVYGLLGLAGDTEAIGVKPDYTATPEEVFTDLVRRHVTNTSSLDIICACRYPRALDDLPSWVPDWSTDQTTPCICINDRYIGGNDFPRSPIAQFQKYAASGTTLPQVVFSGNTMSVKYVPIGIIVALSDVDDGMQFEDLDTFGEVDEDGKSGSDSETFNQWLNMVTEDGPLWDTISNRYGAHNVLDTFCRTLVGDRNNAMMKPPQMGDDEMEGHESSDSGEHVDIAENYDEGDNEIGSTISPEASEIRTSPRGKKRDYSTMEGTNDPSTTDDGPEDLSKTRDQAGSSSAATSETAANFSVLEMLNMTVDGFRASLEVCWGKRLAVLDSGHIGIVHQHSIIGDMAAVVLGCTMPLILRHIDSSRGSFICESYFHGVMDGEVLEGEYSTETIILE
jgi:hypothetical protein